MELLPIIAPIVAFVLAAIAIAILWYWWSSGREGATLGEGEMGSAASLPLEDSMSKELGNRLINTMSSAQAWVTGKMRTRAMGKEMVEVMRLYRDIATGGLVVELDGKYCHTLADITDPQARRRFIGIAESLAQLAEIQPGQTPMATWIPPSVEMPSQPTSPQQPVAAFFGQKEAKVKSGKVVGAEPAPPPRSMADEIEELLQLRLTQNSELSHRSIHIRQGTGGAIRVEVDGHSFDGVGSVEDEQVRAFLQDIIRQWEARQ